MHNDNERYEITSLHHQMVYPWTINPDYFDILFWTNPRSKHYEGFDIDTSKFYEFGEPEVVLYRVPGKPVCLGIQGHPEMMDSYNSPTVEMFNNLLDSLVENK